jgi:putative FmdB family regulatory protein
MKILCGPSFPKGNIMPMYEFECASCGALFEQLLPVSQGQAIRPCESCGKPASRVMSACAFRCGKTLSQEKKRDTDLRQGDMKCDLKERYGVEEVALIPTSQGPTTLESVYSDVLSRGSQIKDEMQATAGKNAEKSREKQKKWLEDAWTRRPQRIAELKKQKEKEKAEKRQKESISVSTKKK